MSKKLFFFFWIIFGINTFYSQTSWELLNPKPTANTGKDIKFVSNNIGYIITSNELLQTINAGATWLKKQNITSGNDMSFYNSLGYIVGNNGYILKTENNGESWNQISTGFNTNNFNTVNIVDNNNIILSSSNNIIKTSNGGLTWDMINIPNGNVVKTTFLSSLVGHAVTTNGKILKTIDGGLNWQIKYSINTIPSSFFTIYFINENIGFATGEHNEMYKTINSGETWIKISGTSEAIYDLYFLNENTGFATGDLGATYKTNDGGNTWSQIFFQNGFIYNTSMYGIFFQNNNIGYATGARGRIIKTEDGGNTWLHHSVTYDDFSQLQIVNNNIGYVQTGNRFYKTTNLGNTWTLVGSLNLGTSVTNSDFTFINENLGYATTGGPYGGHVYKTTDGGITWSILNNGNDIIDEGISSIFFLNENTGFISGGFNQKKVMKTSNGGNSWTQVSDQIFGDIQFVNQLVGYGTRIGNYNGAIYKTTDGGNTWNLSIELAGKSIKSLHFIDANNGYIVGDNSLCYKTNDGGISWQEITVPNGYYTIVKFYSSNIGYIVNENGNLYKTLNGGLTWTLLTTQYGISSVELANNYIFTAGKSGKIYRSETGILTTNEKITDENISIYPNPVTDFVSIKINNNEKISLIELFNIEGKLVYSSSTLNSYDTVKIDMSYFNKGMYFLKINLKNNKTIYKKIILN